MLKELIKSDSDISFQGAYRKFEKAVELAQGSESEGEIRNNRTGFHLTRISVKTPPGQICRRIYKVNTINQTIKVSNTLSAPSGYAETYTLHLNSGTVTNYFKVNL